ncbi:hypothetical protein FA15DRAFT_384092 [Coprinopsis marcescibilis]|uniref:Nucleoprotein TPR/MLP1 domain-containing protein n=1 Tax=Coprinopsis marcescibilis TaxID=230819 RepID=A0A5C3KXA7_COPMA|nr:hypothetical protein FA15DRAFT_384092 [Coprinopsis marcescibilis]
MSRTRGSTSAEPADAGAASTPSQNDAGGDFVVVNIPEELDHHHLAEILPEIPDLTTATPDVVLFLYELVAKQYALLDSSQRDLDELKAENERKDVELEQAFLEKESVSKESETSVISVQEELARVKQERDKLVEENNALKTQLSTVSSSQNATSTEVKALKHQVQDIEREKRDLMGVISRAKKEEETREEEIQSLRASLRAARQDHQTLESQIRELKSQEASTKFKLDSLTQQLKLAQTEAERTNAELSNKTEEYSKYRRAKHAEMLSLQSSHDSLSQEHTATQASLNALKSSHSTQTNQLSQALSKIQALTGQIAEQEARYADEANGLKRLIQTLEDRDRHQREVVEGIQSQWAAVGETSERRENSLKDKLEQEAKRREEAEKRVEQLENVLGKMSRGDLQMPGTPFRTPGTPGGLAMGEFNEAVLSPTVALASRSQRGGKTFTEVYTEYVGLQEENGQLRSKLADMDRTMTAVVAEIEERAPILAQQRIEYERVTREASQLSAQLNQTLQERDAQAKLATETNQKLTKSTAENGLLQQQLSDLGRQIQTLLREIARRDDPTIPIDEELENVPLAQANDVNAIITNNLVLFRNIESLQQQNQRLLRITRELGEKMESEEREYKAAMEQEQGEAIREAHEAMLELGAQLEAQKRSSDGIIQSYVKERDALKAMLRRAEAAAQQAGLNLNIGQQPVTQNTTVVSDSEIARELHEVQEQFEAYKMEMGVDSTRLRDELTSTQRQAHELGANLAKANAKIEFLNDRHRMHQEQFQLNSREFDELNKRNQNLFDQWTRADIECARVSDDLQVANGRLEQLRNECANLRAEKQIWQGVEARLLDENKTLAMERSHLSDLMSNIQKMHNDLERSGENDRRRLEGQLQMLEGQTQDLRTQLSRERDAVRQISMQKDLEARDLQSRLDRAVSYFST